MGHGVGTAPDDFQGMGQWGFEIDKEGDEPGNKKTEAGEGEDAEDEPAEESSEKRGDILEKQGLFDAAIIENDRVKGHGKILSLKLRNPMGSCKNLEI
jgi:hypothetical protein